MYRTLNGIQGNMHESTDIFVDKRYIVEFLGHFKAKQYASSMK